MYTTVTFLAVNAVNQDFLHSVDNLRRDGKIKQKRPPEVSGVFVEVGDLAYPFPIRIDPQWVKLPPLGSGGVWHRAIDTSLPSGEDFTERGPETPIDPADHYIANPRCTVVLLAQKPGPGRRSRVIELSEQHAVKPAG